MMGRSSQVTAFDAKNRLGRLLDRVVAGEELVITRRGEPVAKLVPVERHSNDELEAAIATVRAIRASMLARKVKISRKEVQAWKNEGRR